MNPANTPASTAPTPIPGIALPLLSLAAFGSGISLRVTDPLLPLLAKEFSIALGDASLVVTVFSIAYGLSQLFFGPLGDRYGKYFVVACAAFACALTSMLCALANSFQHLLVARLMAGATAAAIIPLSMAWIGDVVPYERRQPVLARFLIGQILGLSTGVLIGGFAADAGQWRLPFIMVTIIFLLVGIGLILLNRQLPLYAKSTRKIEGAALAHMFAEFRQIAALPWARLVLGTVFLEGAFLYGAFAFIASHLHQVHGVSLSSAGALIMLFGFGGFAFAVGSAKLVHYFGESGLTRWGGIFLAASLLAIGLAPDWWWAIPGCFIAGLGFYMLHNTLQINATQMAPERRGAAVSAFASCFFLGQSVGVGIAGRLLARIGTTNIMLIGAIGVLAVALRFSYYLRKKSTI
ncbi:MFS transporter [Undibacterium sp. Jales W-56]|uniref:MFS transporter n=1 Tax=Undibacterium sp. Jales W-56 TaxID=2897325 RepID=UPI0021D118EE|nr:MFS transporter [Undibacterium sp. Jales W-56]MCU6433598.1 MFS transporter [Undibacterium sp. Jales W-56]